jgi:hypothetical protein
MRNFMLIVLAGLIAFNVQAQSVYTNETSGYSLMVPDSWMKEAHEKGELSFRAISENGTAYFDVNLKKLQDGITSRDHVTYLERFMEKVGYSKNFMPEESRSISGKDAKIYGADDIYAGAYTIEKDGTLMVQMVFVYRKGQYAYITVQTCPQSELEALQDQYNIFYKSFKLL